MTCFILQACRLLGERHGALIEVFISARENLRPMIAEAGGCRLAETRLVRGDAGIFLRRFNRLHRRGCFVEVGAERLEIRLGLEQCAAFLLRHIQRAAFQAGDGCLGRTEAGEEIVDELGGLHRRRELCDVFDDLSKCYAARHTNEEEGICVL